MDRSSSVKTRSPFNRLDLNLSATLLGTSLDDGAPDVPNIGPDMWGELDNEEPINCACKGKCKRKCPCLDHSKKCDKQRCTCREKLCTNRFLQVWLSTYYSTELCMHLTGNIRILLCLGNFQQKIPIDYRKGCLDGTVGCS